LVKGRILILDDSQAVLDAAKAALDAKGYEVTTSSRTVGASRYLKQVDIVIIDFHMPGFDGGDVLSMLRQSAVGAECRFFLYTSDADVARRYAALKFDGAFLRKGDTESLAAQVDAVFRTIRMDRLTAHLRTNRADPRGPK
jgi:DNA-binding NarL/FixJ family response regulator